MTKFTLLLRNLRYFRGVNIAVIVGMAVATAVLTGAMMVGDSVRGSLSDLAIKRLGPVDYALISTRFFPQSLADDLGPDVVPGIIVRGGAVNSSAAGNRVLRTADVQIAALGGAQAGKAPFNFPGFPLGANECAINAELAQWLSVTGPGAQLEFTVPTDTDMPREAALAQRNSNDAQNPVEAAVKDIDVGEDFPSLFSPNGSQRVQRNAWVNLYELQKQVLPDDPVGRADERKGRVNVLLAHAKDSEKPDDAVKALNERIYSIARGTDKGSKTDGLSLYGLRMIDVGNQEASLFAGDIYLAPPAVDAARRAAAALKIPLREVSVNLINSVTVVNAGASSGASLPPSVLRGRAGEGAETRFSAGPLPNPPPEYRGREIKPNATTTSRDAAAGAKAKTLYYAVCAGVSFLDEGKLADDEIAINEWTAGQLGVKVGDKLRIDFYVREPGGALSDASAALPPARVMFTLKYVLPMTGLTVDKQLPPNYKGLTDATSFSDWHPPQGLTINQKFVTKADEQYWKEHRAAPKLFLNFQTAQKLWGGVYGDVTGLRVPAADKDKFRAQFLAELKPESMGLAFRAIKAEQLAAANGGTDFGEFFLMFSFFLIVAAALLVAMLFRLNVEQRARQLGLMSAVGFAPRVLRRLALAEGMALALIGSVIGLAGAIAYTSLIMYGLRTWWIGAVGTTAMTLHVVPLTLMYGWVGSLLVAFFAILWSVWRVGKAQPARLLAGAWSMAVRRKGDGRRVRWVGIVSIAIGIVLVAVTLAVRKISAEQGFGGGAILLCGCLAWLGADLRPRRHAGASFLGAGSLIRLGIRNATRHTARGVLSVGLIAFAAFTLITVAAMKQEGVKDPGDHNSETGGYRLILSAGIPLSTDMNTVAGRKLDGMKDDEAKDAIFQDVHFTMLRQWTGQDISCLNLTKPNSPTILGLPPEMIQRGGFVSGDSIEKNKLWTLLDSDQGEEIPVVADSDTAEYVLKVSVPATIPITDQLGVKRNLKLVATTAHSIFQGQLLMSDANFRKLFPAQNGFSTVLIDTPAGKEMDVAQHLNAALADFSVSVDTTSARLQTYQKVQNTYLETFQALGALGLMLGTLGLAVVLVRTVIERRAELSLLASLGFDSASRVKLVLAENTFLLVLGLALGAVSAVIGILPAVVRESRPMNVLGLAGTLGIVLVVGLISSAFAVPLSGVHVTPADLRRE